MDKSFREIMAHIPTCVSVITIEDESRVLGCTVSSLISLSVEDKSEKVLFVLQEKSLTGSKLKEIKSYALNILNSDQMTIALEAGSRKIDLDLSYFVTPMSLENNLEYQVISESRFALALRFEKSFIVDKSEIYVSSVVGAFEPASYKTPMIYMNREFGSFARNIST